MNRKKLIALVGAACFSFFANPAWGLTLVALTNAPSAPNGWIGVACSADGTKFVAAAYEGSIYTSADSGITWVSNAAPVKPWFSVSSSADGNKLAATAFNTTGQVWTNSGTTWAATTAPTSASTSYGSVSCSADGSRMVAIRAAGSPVTSFGIFASADFGATWHQTSAPNIPWSAVTCSADGTKLVATVSSTNVIYTSVNSGTNWVSHSVPLNNWFDVSSSADGSKLAAITSAGGIYTSADSGVTWVSNIVTKTTLYEVTSSADGSNIVAVGVNALYNTTNFGQNWISNSPPAPLLRTVASSADGLRGVMAGATGPSTPMLYTFALATVPPPLACLVVTNAQIAVVWPSSATGFQLQQNTNLSTTVWSSVTNLILVTNGMNEVILSPTNPASFFRLINQ